MGPKRLLISLLPNRTKRDIFKKIEFEHGTDALVDMVHEDFFEHTDNTKLIKELWKMMFKRRYLTL